jgi:hypothetical protein
MSLATTRSRHGRPLERVIPSSRGAALSFPKGIYNNYRYVTQTLSVASTVSFWASVCQRRRPTPQGRQPSTPSTRPRRSDRDTVVRGTDAILAPNPGAPRKFHGCGPPNGCGTGECWFRDGRIAASAYACATPLPDRQRDLAQIAAIQGNVRGFPCRPPRWFRCLSRPE